MSVRLKPWRILTLLVELTLAAVKLRNEPPQLFRLLVVLQNVGGSARFRRPTAVSGQIRAGWPCSRRALRLPVVCTLNWSRLAAAVRLRGITEAAHLGLLAPFSDEILRS